ncbi:MAG: Uma2 family endonuclease [Chloroflexi bacterium]|nr:Uma2 family endonuclease [Chloroflexota bacterium]
MAAVVAKPIEMPRRRFTVDEYYRMAEAGILAEDDRVELIDGEIVHMSPISSRHAAGVKRVRRLFDRRLGDRVVVSVQDPVRLGSFAEPQPDIALLHPREDLYAEAHPGPENVLLIVEVADTSIQYDRQVKVPLYARAGVPEVWLADLTGDAVEAYREPSPDGYRVVRRLRRGERIAPQALPDLEIAVDELLGPAKAPER